MNGIVYLNEGKLVPSNYEVNDEEDGTLYLYNGASNHMNGDRRYFSYIDDSITGKYASVMTLASTKEKEQ